MTISKSKKDFDGSYNYVNKFYNNLEIADYKSLIEQSSLDSGF